MPKEWTAPLGECNEQLRERSGIPRERQDAFAARSHRLAARAWDDGFYDRLVLPVAGLTRDEGIRPGTGPAEPAALKAVFRPDGTITAGNASPLSDGAAALLLAAPPSPSGSAAPRWPGSPAAPRTPSPRRSSGTRRSRPPRRRCAGPGSTGPGSAPSN